MNLVRKKLSNYSKNQKMKKKRKYYDNDYYNSDKETLKVITAMRMTMTTKAKMSKLMPERKKTLK